ncbi:Pectinesterase inhibitor domain [Arabidopsis thaliana x Arabidopsis arenosa]|uniref:Pectinesterase inhibitor domain n=1 Tax=Arabidopsis thaliana x Arabidopsis arenosa TaxID=1240361 RepID=A0A8T1Z451_9BRAS|nr:Pectinesterase inhibitor domain [Arabidopsis thaliana x Arabidopsis arenosa]
MATMFIKHIMFPLSLLLLLFIASPTTNAMLIKDMYTFCKETADVDFCLKYIGTDKRILAAKDFNDVLLIAFSQCKIQVSEATKQINKVRQNFSGPNGKRRIKRCEINYGLASAFFDEAYEIGILKGVQNKAHNAALDGLDYVRACEDEWKMNGPVQKSPLTFYNTNIDKLFSIIFIIVQKLNG